MDCHLATDVEAARQHLRSICIPEQHSSFDGHLSLSKRCSNMSIRDEFLSVDTASEDFCLFQEYAIEWTKDKNFSLKCDENC